MFKWKKQPITHNYGLKAKVTRTRQAGGKPCSNFATLVLIIKITLLTIKMMVQMTIVMLEVPGKASGVGRFPETKVLSKQLAQDTSPSSAPFHQLLRSLQLPPISSHLARSSLWAQWSFWSNSISQSTADSPKKINAQSLTAQTQLQTNLKLLRGSHFCLVQNSPS